MFWSFLESLIIDLSQEEAGSLATNLSTDGMLLDPTGGATATSEAPGFIDNVSPDLVGNPLEEAYYAGATDEGFDRVPPKGGQGFPDLQETTELLNSPDYEIEAELEGLPLDETTKRLEGITTSNDDTAAEDERESDWDEEEDVENEDDLGLQDDRDEEDDTDEETDRVDWHELGDVDFAFDEDEELQTDVSYRALGEDDDDEPPVGDYVEDTYEEVDEYATGEFDPETQGVDLEEGIEWDDEDINRPDGDEEGEAATATTEVDFDADHFDIFEGSDIEPTETEVDPESMFDIFNLALNIDDTLDLVNYSLSQSMNQPAFAFFDEADVLYDPFDFMDLSSSYGPY